MLFSEDDDKVLEIQPSYCTANRVILHIQSVNCIRMTELEKALSGEQFSRRDAEVVAFQSRVKDLCFEFNTTIPSSPRRSEILKELVTGYNQYVFVESGFQCVMGRNIHFKGTAFVNMNCTFLDSNIITIGENVWLGANVTVLPGVTIGDRAVIGAGSVVTRDIPADTIAVGNPCRVVRHI